MGCGAFSASEVSARRLQKGKAKSKTTANTEIAATLYRVFRSILEDCSYARSSRSAPDASRILEPIEPAQVVMFDECLSNCLRCVVGWY